MEGVEGGCGVGYRGMRVWRVGYRGMRVWRVGYRGVEGGI